MTEILIPEGINFECTGCANCCLEWPVPVTEEDYRRIGAAGAAAAGGGSLFRALKVDDLRLSTFAYTLEKRADGRCEFLTADKRCALHSEHGPAMKPAMCQLFPYTFSQTPSGVYASVSFASTGTLYNSGRPLAEQTELLEEKWQLFRRLFPTIEQDWSNTQIVDGCPLAWDDYLAIEKEMSARIRGGSGALLRRLSEAGACIKSRLPAGADAEKAPPLEARPKVVDQIVIRHLFALYLPDDVFSCDRIDLDARGLMTELVSPPPTVAIACGGAAFGFQALLNCRLGELDADSEDLLTRFVYCRLFAKLYFGAGFAGFSLLAGWHHLLLIIVLVRLKLKTGLLAGAPRPDFEQVAEVVRALERRLTQVRLSPESRTVLEVLLTSPTRAERVLSLAS